MTTYKRKKELLILWEVSDQQSKGNTVFPTPYIKLISKKKIHNLGPYFSVVQFAVTEAAAEGNWKWSTEKGKSHQNKIHPKTLLPPPGTCQNRAR